MLGIYQKFYSAINCLNNICNDNDIFDNISYIDNFLGEFRNITFILQKKFSKDEEKDVYKRLLKKNFTDNEIMDLMKDLRNETTKENPFDLKICVDCIAYLEPKIKFNIMSSDLSDPKLKIENIEECIKKVLNKIETDASEIFFSYFFYYNSNSRNINILEISKQAILTMFDFLTEFEKEISAKDNTELIKKKISERIVNLYIIEMKNYVNGVYNIKDKTIKIENDKIRFIALDKNNKPITKFDRIPISSLKKNGLIEEFIWFVFTHITTYNIQGNLFPVFFVRYNDETYSIEPCFTYSKAELYKAIMDLEKRAIIGNINSVFFCTEMIGESKELKSFKKMTHDEKMKKHDMEYVLFTMIDKKEETVNLLIEVEKSKDIDYLKQLINPLKSNCDIFFLKKLEEIIKK